MTSLFLSVFMSQVVFSQEYSDCINYNTNNNTLIITCDSTLSQIDDKIMNKTILDKELDGIWILNAILKIDKNASLLISSNDTKWLKITNNIDNTPNFISVLGKATIDGVKITSWNSSDNKVIEQNNNGSIPRPFIKVERDSGPVNILNSEIAFLGYKPSPSQGISYQGGDGSIISNNKFHNLWYGFYSSSLGNVTISNNRYYNNSIYGIDPHTGSHDINIIGNEVYNTKLGIICSYNCYNILFENNKVYGSEKAGIMFSKNTNNSIAKNNTIENARTGISVSESHGNLVYNNSIRDSETGIKVRESSSNNKIYDNIVKDGKTGIRINSYSMNNTIQNNTLSNFTQAIRISNTSGVNFLIDNDIGSVKKSEYYIVNNGSMIIKNQTFTNDKVKGGEGNNAVIIDESGIINIKGKIIDTTNNQFNRNLSGETLSVNS